MARVRGQTRCLSAFVETTATTRRNQGARCFLVTVCVESMLSTAMAVDGDGASAARRRREAATPALMVAS